MRLISYGWSLDYAEADTIIHPASEACYGRPENVGVLAVVIPEFGFRHVKRQVFGRNVGVPPPRPRKPGPGSPSREWERRQGKKMIAAFQTSSFEVSRGPHG